MAAAASTSDIWSLILAADLTDETDRLMLADALEDCGDRHGAGLCRDLSDPRPLFRDAAYRGTKRARVLRLERAHVTASIHEQSGNGSIEVMLFYTSSIPDATPYVFWKCHPCHLGDPDEADLLAGDMMAMYDPQSFGELGEAAADIGRWLEARGVELSLETVWVDDESSL